MLVHDRIGRAYYDGILWGFFSFDQEIEPVEPHRPQRGIRYWSESCLVHYHDDQNGVFLSFRCGPVWGHHASWASDFPCDNLGSFPKSGHFSVSLNSKPVLASPDDAYSLQTALGSVLLVDGCGQIDDISYPMSIPQKRWAGERIDQVYWDERSSQEIVILNLQSAYPENLRVAEYIRTFLFGPDR